MLTFHCSGCGQLLQVRDEFAGQKARCAKCGAVSDVPRPSPVPPTGDPTSAIPEGLLRPAQGPEEIGRLGAYRVCRVLGVGRTAVVFEAVDEQLQRPVALKALLPSLAANAAARLRLLREARATAGLDHPHIVSVYLAGEDHRVPFLAMPLLQGESLDTRLRRERVLPVPEVLRIGREIAEGLAAAHAHGIIHRDINPANVWLEAPAGRVKLLDFGLASALGDGTHLTRTGAVVGTPAYLAPEQAAGGPVGEAADLFSLGCVLYRCCTGRPPFRGPDALAVFAALAGETPRPVRELNPQVPAALSDLIARLLAKDPAGRPPSAHAVARELAALEAPPPTGLAVAVGRAEEPPSGDTLVGADAVPRPAAARPRGATPGVRVAVLLGGLLALAGLFACCLTTAGVLAWRELAHTPGGAGTPARERPGHWTVVFRADDPGLWDTDTRRGADQFTIPLRQAPSLVRYVRLRRMDTGEALIVTITPSQLTTAPDPAPGRGAWWNGSNKFEYSGRHLGIAEPPIHKFPNHDGVICIQNQGWDAYSGSGFGHKCMHDQDGQKYCWRGREIPRTVFEIAVTGDELTAEEKKLLLPPP